jgi:hypothetical protein
MLDKRQHYTQSPEGQRDRRAKSSRLFPDNRFGLMEKSKIIRSIPKIPILIITPDMIPEICDGARRMSLRQPGMQWYKAQHESGFERKTKKKKNKQRIAAAASNCIAEEKSNEWVCK